MTLTNPPCMANPLPLALRPSSLSTLFTFLCLCRYPTPHHEGRAGGGRRGSQRLPSTPLVGPLHRRPSSSSALSPFQPCPSASSPSTAAHPYPIFLFSPLPLPALSLFPPSASSPPLPVPALSPAVSHPAAAASAPALSSSLPLSLFPPSHLHYLIQPLQLPRLVDVLQQLHVVGRGRLVRVLLVCMVRIRPDLHGKGGGGWPASAGLLGDPVAATPNYSVNAPTACCSIAHIATSVAFSQRFRLSAAQQDE